MRCTKGMEVNFPKRRKPKRARRDETDFEFGRRGAAQFLDFRLAVVKVERRRHLDSRVHRHILWPRARGVRASRGKESERETRLLVANVDAVKVDALPPLVAGEVFPLGRDALAASNERLSVNHRSAARCAAPAGESRSGGLTRILPTARQTRSPSSPVRTAAGHSYVSYA